MLFGARALVPGAVLPTDPAQLARSESSDGTNSGSAHSSSDDDDGSSDDDGDGSIFHSGRRGGICGAASDDSGERTPSVNLESNSRSMSFLFFLYFCFYFLCHFLMNTNTRLRPLSITHMVVAMLGIGTEPFEIGAPSRLFTDLSAERSVSSPLPLASAASRGTEPPPGAQPHTLPLSPLSPGSARLVVTSNQQRVASAAAPGTPGLQSAPPSQPPETQLGGSASVFGGTGGGSRLAAPSGGDSEPFGGAASVALVRLKHAVGRRC